MNQMRYNTMRICITFPYLHQARRRGRCGKMRAEPKIPVSELALLNLDFHIPTAFKRLL